MKALVTAGTRGMGRAIALRLMQSGHDCLVTGTTGASCGNAPEGVKALVANLALPADVTRLAETLSGLEIDILVNNAGINIMAPTEEFVEADFDALMSVNLKAPFALCRAAIPHMKQSGWGRINITSLWSVRAQRNDAAYCASKFGLDGLTASLAAELAPHGILVNAVAPGYILTDTVAEGFSQDRMAGKDAESIPLGRYGKPEEIAEIVDWLASRANSYMTGQNLLVDGGLSRTAFPRI